MSDNINMNLPLPAAAYEQEVVYKECKHNHAASLGRVSYDGCREFLAHAPNKNPMLCAACDCHRNFHRKYIFYNPIPPQTPPTPLTETVNDATPTPTPPPPPPTTTLVQLRVPNYPPEVPETKPKRKKRTVFTPEQRNRMMSFADKLGWKPQKANKDEIQRFCLEMDISRRMFLVWLSNNRSRAMQNKAATTSAGN